MDHEITCKELFDLPSDSFVLYDMRDSYSFSCGNVKGSLNFPALSGTSFPENKKIILICKNGNYSEKKASELRGKNIGAYYLKGGYTEYVLYALENEKDDKKLLAEKSIQKKFHKDTISKFVKAITEFDLISEGDRIAVCISGGKDSMLMAMLFRELKRYDKFPFELVYLVMDPGYSPENRKIIEENGRILGIPLTVFETDIFSSVYHIEDSPCYLCARMRRGHLYAKARELGCNKIALGHHFDDVIETILMGMLYGGQTQTMMPKIRSTNFGEMTLIRPMYFIREETIKHWRDYNGLHFLQCACRFTENIAENSFNEETTSKRQEIKNLIKELKKTNPQVEKNIYRSSENVNLRTVLSYKDENGERHHFLDNF